MTTRPATVNITNVGPNYQSAKSITSRLCSFQAHKFYIYSFHARIQKILSEGVQLWKRFFLVDEGWVDPNSTLSTPLLARQRNTI